MRARRTRELARSNAHVGNVPRSVRRMRSSCAVSAFCSSSPRPGLPSASVDEVTLLALLTLSVSSDVVSASRGCLAAGNAEEEAAAAAVASDCAGCHHAHERTVSARPHTLAHARERTAAGRAGDGSRLRMRTASMAPRSAAAALAENERRDGVSPARGAAGVAGTAARRATLARASSVPTGISGSGCHWLGAPSAISRCSMSSTVLRDASTTVRSGTCIAGDTGAGASDADDAPARAAASASASTSPTVLTLTSLGDSERVAPDAAPAAPAAPAAAGGDERATGPLDDIGVGAYATGAGRDTLAGTATNCALDATASLSTRSLERSSSAVARASARRRAVRRRRRHSENARAHRSPAAPRGSAAWSS